VDECLKKLGATRILARGVGDGQYSSKQFDAWLQRLWPSLLATAGLKSKLAEYRKRGRVAPKVMLRGTVCMN
jgi:hypothetical protein